MTANQDVSPPASGDAAGPRTFSALICAYTLDRWDDIEAAVRSLRDQSRPPDEIILVSDHNDALLDRARATFPDVRCLANSGTPGLSDARNTGVAAATGDVVGFLDDDASADPDWVASMLAAYADLDVLGVGGNVVPAWASQRPTWLPEEFLWVVGCSYEGQPRIRAEVRNPIGANMSFRRAVLLAAGGFDASIGRLGKDAAGCEETEFSIRARALHPGGRVLLEPAARCAHHVPAERLTRRYFRRRCAAEGRSKALVSRLAGQDAALESERVYVRTTLPLGVLRGLRDLAAGDVGGAARAWAIIEGTLLTAANFAWATRRLSRAARSTPASP